MITSIIPNNIYNNKTSNTKLKFILPFEYISSYPLLFDKLNELNNYNISLEMSTLEEAFLNFAKIELEIFNKNNDNDIHDKIIECNKIEINKTIPNSFYNKSDPSICIQIYYL